LFNEDKCRLVEKMQQLENQLVTSMEKHKICQQEVIYVLLIKENSLYRIQRFLKIILIYKKKILRLTKIFKICLKFWAITMGITMISSFLKN
jgi:hypothetical protein